MLDSMCVRGAPFLHFVPHFVSIASPSLTLAWPCVVDGVWVEGGVRRAWGGGGGGGWWPVDKWSMSGLRCRCRLGHVVGPQKKGKKEKKSSLGDSWHAMFLT